MIGRNGDKYCCPILSHYHQSILLSDVIGIEKTRGCYHKLVKIFILLVILFHAPADRLLVFLMPNWNSLIFIASKPHKHSVEKSRAELAGGNTKLNGKLVFLVNFKAFLFIFFLYESTTTSTLQHYYYSSRCPSLYLKMIRKIFLNFFSLVDFIFFSRLSSFIFV